MKPAFQFGIVRLLVLTTLVALVLAWMRQIHWNAATAAIVSIYFAFMVLWITFRVPVIWRELRRIRRARKSIQDAAAADLELRRRKNPEADEVQ